MSSGANYKDIRIRLDGVQRLSITDRGDLRIETQYGCVTQKAPKVFQCINGQRVDLRAAFELIDKTTYGFAIQSPFDPLVPLTIDPELVYGTYVGGSSNDISNSNAFSGRVAGAPDGGIYMFGCTIAADFPATLGAFSGPSDAVLLKFGLQHEQLEWATFLGGSARELSFGLFADDLGSTYVCGDTTSSDFPVSNLSFKQAISGSVDGYVAKFNTVGRLMASTYLGGNPDGNADRPDAIAARNEARADCMPYFDPVTSTFAGDCLPEGTIEGYFVYVTSFTGATEMGGYPVTEGAFDVGHNGASDVALTRADSKPYMRLL